MTVREQIEAILLELDPLLEKGYMFSLTLDKCGFDLIDVSGGDSNCPHRKFYDPKDGHGQTLLNDFKALAPIAVAEEMVVEIAKIEGKAYVEKQK